MTACTVTAKSPDLHLDVRKQGEVTVVCLGRQRIRDEVELKQITDELYGVADGPDSRYLLLNLAGVVPPLSKLIGNLVALHRKMKAKGGKFGLCHVESEVERTLRVMHLHQMFPIWESECDGVLALEETASASQA